MKFRRSARGLAIALQALALGLSGLFLLYVLVANGVLPDLRQLKRGRSEAISHGGAKWSPVFGEEGVSETDRPVRGERARARAFGNGAHGLRLSHPKNMLLADDDCSPPRRRRVLIVEDDDDSRELLVELVELLGHRATGSPNADHALRIARETRPEIVLIDIGLPDANGCDIARSLRASPETARTRLVALTGYGDSAMRQQATEAGFDDFVVKPFSSEGLAALLDRQV